MANHYTDKAIGKEILAGSTVFIYIGEENLANCIPFSKFAEIFPLQNFPKYAWYKDCKNNWIS